MKRLNHARRVRVKTNAAGSVWRSLICMASVSRSWLPWSFPSNACSQLPRVGLLYFVLAVSKSERASCRHMVSRPVWFRPRFSL